jgi:hypothetical protein
MEAVAPAARHLKGRFANRPYNFFGEVILKFLITNVVVLFDR